LHLSAVVAKNVPLITRSAPHRAVADTHPIFAGFLSLNISQLFGGWPLFATPQHSFAMQRAV
jgi:hypothetical protein